MVRKIFQKNNTTHLSAGLIDSSIVNDSSNSQYIHQQQRLNCLNSSIVVQTIIGVIVSKFIIDVIKSNVAVSISNVAVSISFAVVSISFAVVSISVAVVSISFAVVSISFADDSISFADVSISFADDSISFADDNISVADISISVADDSISVADDSISVADDSISFADDNISVADVSISIEKSKNLFINNNQIFYKHFKIIDMTTSRDWLPRNHEDLYNQANATTDYLTSDVLARIGITGPVYSWYSNEFIPKHSTFKLAFEDWRNQADRTPAKTATLISAENVFKPSYRQLYIGYLKGNPLVTDTDLVEMGLPKHSSGSKTPPSPPTTIIEATFDTSKLGIIGINFRDKNEKGTAKPKGVRGAEIAWGVLDTPPTDWSQLLHSAFDTRTPAELVFSGDQRGKTVYVALRWENNIGQKGPWSEIYSAIIP